MTPRIMGAFAHPRAVAFILVLTLLLVESAWIPVIAQSERSESPVEGTWALQITGFDCATGVRRPPIWSMVTFARGGTLTDTTGNQMFPGPRTAGLGRWSATGGNTFRSTSVAFILLGPTVQPWAMRIDQHSIRLTGDQFVSDATVEFFVVPGALPAPSVPVPPRGCAMATGIRYP